MRRMAGQFRTTAWSALALAFIALTIRVLVPGGYMIGPSVPGAGVPIILCTAQGAETVLLGQESRPADAAQGSQGDHSDPQGPDHPCAFAGVAAGFAPDAPLVVDVVAWGPEGAPLAFPTEARPGRGLAAPPPPQTGPPRLI